jgi:hypothetical protein
MTEKITTLDSLSELMEKDFEENQASSVESVDQTGLKSIAELARQIRDIEELIEGQEVTLKAHKKSLQKLTDEDLPSMMAEIGVASFNLDDGSTVNIKQTYGASILVEKRPEAYQWLRDHGYDDIIKNTVSCQFGRGEDEKAHALFEVLCGADGRPDYSPDQKEEIHSQTLRAFVKERCEKGDDFPMTLFGAYVGQRAVIKGSKK